MDAAVATALCLGVVNPSVSGMGGGAFLLIHIDPNNNKQNHHHNKQRHIPPVIDARDPSVEEIINGRVLTMIDARETAPEASSPTMFEGLPPHVSTVGGLAVAVPGELRGLEYAHAKHGSLSWRDVCDPAIRLAREGFPISRYLAKNIQNHIAERWDFMPLRMLLSKDGPGREPLQEHDIMRNPTLANTLEAIAEQGSDALYDGPYTEEFVQDIQSVGGILTEDDMRRYRPTVRTPLIAKNIGGYTLVGAPPPSSGGATVIGAARYLAGYRSNGRVPPKHHRMAEAMKHAFAIRMSLSDPEFDQTGKVVDAVNDLVYTDYMNNLRRNNSSDENVLPLSSYGGERWAQMDNGRIAPLGGSHTITIETEQREEREATMTAQEQRSRNLNSFNYLDDNEGTAHISVMDIHGNAVSITSSLNTYFGSGVVSESTGILLNSQMDDFATPGRPNYYGLSPSESNYIQPGKKPLSSMSPTLVFQQSHTSSLGNILMALGASGGPKIISAVLQVFWNYAILDMSLFDAVHTPRIHDQLLYHDKPGQTLVEKTGKINGFPLEISMAVQTELESRGHHVVPIGYAGSVQAVAMSKPHHKRTMTAVADARTGGKPAGL